ncbi:LacI family DNA-binding transcriptional regulator [Winogradskyella sp. PG-2]|uniref:LacI family DNA-binding transcriptional regulator n=1 Tax=Winogradskyella sp. PG-2 TaxID=754409 RepID=UPI0004586270|nr:LacI family DNA-binding transcriptional regulator [Winogradskyella sp. PG-2]BAO75502.1 LacI family transcriptional regulator [Winogradskyella sp. PG-2]
MRTNSITLKNIASILNLSISTVSKALRNSSEISTRTKNKVIKMANALNYKPNIHASALKNKRSYILGIILPDLKDNFFLESLNGITEESSRNDYKIMVYQSCNDYNKEVKYSNLLSKSNIIDGLIFSSTRRKFRPKECGHLESFISGGIPIIYINKQKRVSVNSCHYERGFEIGKNSVKELLSKIKDNQLNLSA